MIVNRYDDSCASFHGLDPL